MDSDNFTNPPPAITTFLESMEIRKTSEMTWLVMLLPVLWSFYLVFEI